MNWDAWKGVWMQTMIVAAICFVVYMKTRGLDSDTMHAVLAALGTLGGVTVATQKMRAQSDQFYDGGGGGSRGQSLRPAQLPPTGRPPSNVRLLVGWALGGLATMALSFAIEGCTPAQTPGPDSGDAAIAVTPGNGPCTSIANATGNVVLEKICATGEEIAIIAKEIFAMRADSGAPTPAEACTPIPSTPPICATPRELHAGIEKIKARRRAAFVLDGGS